MLAEGKYVVLGYNGLDAILRRDDGHMETLNGKEFSEELERIVYPGETIHVQTISKIWPNARTKDERQSEAFHYMQAEIKRSQA